MLNCKVTPKEIEQLPALIDVNTASRLSGEHPRTVQLRCQRGEIPCTRFSRRWMISTEKFLKQLGL